MRSESFHSDYIYDKQGNTTDFIDTFSTQGIPPDQAMMALEELQEDPHADKNDMVKTFSDVLINLVSYLLEMDNIKSISARAMLLGYVLRPELIGNKTLAEIGALVGTTKQNLSRILQIQDKILLFRGRSRLSQSHRNALSKATKAAWKRRKALV